VVEGFLKDQQDDAPGEMAEWECETMMSLVPEH